MTGTCPCQGMSVGAHQVYIYPSNRQFAEKIISFGIRPQDLGLDDITNRMRRVTPALQYDLSLIHI